MDETLRTNWYGFCQVLEKTEQYSVHNSCQ